jgi:hypothetical protein
MSDHHRARNRLFLLTDFPPDAQGGGAVILRSLLTAEDRERIVWATLSPVGRANGDAVVSLASSGRRSLLQDATLRMPLLRRHVRSALRSSGADAAWVVAHGAAVRLAPTLIETGVPVHVTVHDDPAWAYAILTRRYFALAPLLARDLSRSLRGAHSVDVVSQGMARRYRAMHGIDSAIVHRGLSARVQPSPAYDRRKGLSVAVLGSTYGSRELGALLQALALVGEQQEISTRLTVIGGADEPRLRQLCPPGVALEATGHLAESDGLARLRDAYLLYLCYPFSPRGRVLRTTSFPTKLSTYVMAARPLLLHMPADSSVAFLADRSAYGTLWSSLSPAEGAEIIGRAWQDEPHSHTFHDAAETLRKRHFDLDQNRSALMSRLNSLGSVSRPA